MVAACDVIEFKKAKKMLKILVLNVVNSSYYSIILLLPLKNIFDCCVLIWHKKMEGFPPCPKTHVFGHLVGGGSRGGGMESPCRCCGVYVATTTTGIRIKYSFG